MMLTMMYGKIHRATVTHCELDYNGSMGIDRAMLDAAGLIPGQQIDVLNINNGKRFTTYILEEAAGSKRFGVYGAAAHLVDPGDKVIIIAYAKMEPAEAKAFKPKVLILDEQNNVINQTAAA